jgi:hypothetical protein
VGVGAARGGVGVGAGAAVVGEDPFEQPPAITAKTTANTTANTRTPGTSVFMYESSSHTKRPRTSARASYG